MAAQFGSAWSVRLLPRIRMVLRRVAKPLSAAQTVQILVLVLASAPSSHPAMHSRVGFRWMPVASPMVHLQNAGYRAARDGRFAGVLQARRPVTMLFDPVASHHAVSTRQWSGLVGWSSPLSLKKRGTT
jgi:hypothetical protein